MQRVLLKLKFKGVAISDEETEAAAIAILLHDIGHGPFSHALEGILIKDFRHERMTLALIEQLNDEFAGKLDLSISMFKGLYHRPFFHQLISSQLDVDRLDYLTRDSFHTGVREGGIGLDRLIETMVVQDDRIFIMKKGIYALENYIMARNLMYKQVYLHKTNIAADAMLILLFKRLSELKKRNTVSFKANFIPYLSPSLMYFVVNEPSAANNQLSDELISHYTTIDDYDIWFAVKQLVNHSDKILSYLSKSLINRTLFKIRALEDSQTVNITELKEQTKHQVKEYLQLDISEDLLSYFYDLQEVEMEAYKGGAGKINVLFEDGSSKEFSEAADTKHIQSLMTAVKKKYVLHLKGLEPTFISQQGKLL
jgi:HD superfamily phosphohydrolase